MYANARFEVAKLWYDALAPKPRIAVSDCADEHIVLTTDESKEPGQWRTRRNPALREPMDCMSWFSPVREMVVVSPVQWGKTMLARAIILSYMKHDPCPILLCFPSEVAEKLGMAQKYGPLFKLPVVEDMLVSTKSRDAANTKGHKEYISDGKNGSIHVHHAGGTADHAATLTVKLVVTDEFSKFPPTTRDGSDWVALFKNRTTSFGDEARLVYVSSPKDKGACPTSKMYEDSDQRQYHVPCPHCGEKQTLKMANLYDDGKGGAHYVCESSGCIIEERHKGGMLARGEWIPANPGHPRRGYQINFLYFPPGLGITWAAGLLEFRKASKDKALLKAFYNERLGLPWEDPALAKLSLHTLADRVEAFSDRICPKPVQGLALSVDTQDNRLEYLLVGWGVRNIKISEQVFGVLQGWVMDYGAFEGDPFEDAVWAQLAAYAQTPVQHEDGYTLPISVLAIDSGGHRTHAVYNFVRSRPIPRAFALRGAQNVRALPLGKAKWVDVRYRGQYDKLGAELREIGTITCKDWFMGALTQAKEADVNERALHFSHTLPPFFFEGLITELYDPTTGRYRKKKGEEKEGNTARNEPLDLMVYNYAAIQHEELMWHKRGLERWPAKLWPGENRGHGAPAFWLPD